MFIQEIKTVINFWDKHINGVYSIPGDTALIAAENIWKMSCWIHEEFIRECRTITREQFNQPENFERTQEFAMHSASRIISYVNHIYLMEGIINRAYNDTCSFLRKYINKTVIPDDVELIKRNLEIKSLKEFRHMVAAHTVYAKPSKKDDYTTEVNSLLPFSSYGFPLDRGPCEISFSVTQMSVGGEKSKRTIPRIALHPLHQKIGAHLGEWCKMFNLKLEDATPYLPIETADYKIDFRKY